MDRRQKFLHEQRCEYNPKVQKRNIRFAQIKANLLQRYLDIKGK